MANITIRDLPDKTKEILRIHAVQAGVSLEAYVAACAAEGISCK
ncbi:hypothetical protein [Nitrosomonas communis]|nr:hypothetical protein [Nitrosomonas communis]